GQRGLLAHIGKNLMSGGPRRLNVGRPSPLFSAASLPARTSHAGSGRQSRAQGSSLNGGGHRIVAKSMKSRGGMIDSFGHRALPGFAGHLARMETALPQALWSEVVAEAGRLIETERNFLPVHK